MAIVCRQCGRRNPDGVQFCTNPDCGAYLGWDGPDPAGPATGTAPGPAARAQSAAAAVTLADTALGVEPGDTATTTATVYNGGSQVEQFAVTVLGPAAPWATVEPATLRIYPAGQAECTVRFTPPREVSTQAGRVWFTVRVASTLHPGLLAGANGTLDVGAFREVTAVLAPQEASGRGRTQHRIDITNAGNVIEPVRLEATDPTGKIQFGLPAGEFALNPGRHPVPLTVRPPTRWLGKPPRAPFTVTVTPRPTLPPIRLDGTRDVVPLIAGWVPKAAIALVALAALAAALLVPGSPLAIRKDAGKANPPLPGASATVAPPTATPTGVPTPTGQATTGPPTSPPSSAAPPGSPTLSVVVDSRGNRLAGNTAAVPRRARLGHFDVTFPADVSGCSYVAAVDDPTEQAVPEPPFVSTASGGGRVVAVEIRNRAGGGLDRAFHLQVQCRGRSGWVVVNDTAARPVQRANGVLSAESTGPGGWKIVFVSRVQTCAYVATIGSAGQGVPPPPGLVSTAPVPESNTVVVRTSDPNGQPASRPFHLQVACGVGGDGSAAVDATGHRQRGTATEASGRGNGIVAVTFGRDMGNCSYVATPASPGLAYTTGGDNGVTVKTTDANGALTRLPFGLQTVC